MDGGSPRIVETDRIRKEQGRIGRGGNKLNQHLGARPGNAAHRSEATAVVHILYRVYDISLTDHNTPQLQTHPI